MHSFKPFLPSNVSTQLDRKSNSKAFLQSMLLALKTLINTFPAIKVGGDLLTAVGVLAADHFSKDLGRATKKKKDLLAASAGCRVLVLVLLLDLPVHEYLAHRKPPPPLGPPKGPGRRPTVGSWGGAVLTAR